MPTTDRPFADFNWWFGNSNWVTDCEQTVLPTNPNWSMIWQSWITSAIINNQQPSSNIIDWLNKNTSNYITSIHKSFNTYINKSRTNITCHPSLKWPSPKKYCLFFWCHDIPYKKIPWKIPLKFPFLMKIPWTPWEKNPMKIHQCSKCCSISSRNSQVFLGLNRPSSDTVAGLSRPFGYHELRRFRGAAPWEGMDVVVDVDIRLLNYIVWYLHMV